MARNLNEITHQLALTLNAHGFDDCEASNAISDALTKCLPSYQAMLTLALEAAKQGRDEENERIEGLRCDRAHGALSGPPDDLPW